MNIKSISQLQILFNNTDLLRLCSPEDVRTSIIKFWPEFKWRFASEFNLSVFCQLLDFIGLEYKSNISLSDAIAEIDRFYKSATQSTEPTKETKESILLSEACDHFSDLDSDDDFSDEDKMEMALAVMQSTDTKKRFEYNLKIIQSILKDNLVLFEKFKFDLFDVFLIARKENRNIDIAIKLLKQSKDLDELQKYLDILQQATSQQGSSNLLNKVQHDEITSFSNNLIKSNSQLAFHWCLKKLEEYKNRILSCQKEYNELQKKGAPELLIKEKRKDLETAKQTLKEFEQSKIIESYLYQAENSLSLQQKRNKFILQSHLTSIESLEKVLQETIAQKDYGYAFLLISNILNHHSILGPSKEKISFIQKLLANTVNIRAPLSPDQKEFDELRKSLFDLYLSFENPLSDDDWEIFADEKLFKNKSSAYNVQLQSLIQNLTLEKKQSILKSLPDWNLILSSNDNLFISELIDYHFNNISRNSISNCCYIAMEIGNILENNSNIKNTEFLKEMRLKLLFKSCIENNRYAINKLTQLARNADETTQNKISYALMAAKEIDEINQIIANLKSDLHIHGYRKIFLLSSIRSKKIKSIISNLEHLKNQLSTDFLSSILLPSTNKRLADITLHHYQKQVRKQQTLFKQYLRNNSLIALLLHIIFFPLIVPTLVNYLYHKAQAKMAKEILGTEVLQKSGFKFWRDNFFNAQDAIAGAKQELLKQYQIYRKQLEEIDIELELLKKSETTSLSKQSQKQQKALELNRLKKEIELLKTSKKLNTVALYHGSDLSCMDVYLDDTTLITEDGKFIDTLFVEHKSRERKPWIVYFGGKSNHYVLENRHLFMAHSLSANVVAVQNRGLTVGSGAKTINHKDLGFDGLAAVKYLIEEKGVDPKDITIMGYCGGAPSAIESHNILQKQGISTKIAIIRSFNSLAGFVGYKAKERFSKIPMLDKLVKLAFKIFGLQTDITGHLDKQNREDYFYLDVIPRKEALTDEDGKQKYHDDHVIQARINGIHPKFKAKRHQIKQASSNLITQLDKLTEILFLNPELSDNSHQLDNIRLLRLNLDFLIKFYQLSKAIGSAGEAAVHNVLLQELKTRDNKPVTDVLSKFITKRHASDKQTDSHVIEQVQDIKFNTQFKDFLLERGFDLNDFIHQLQSHSQIAADSGKAIQSMYGTEFDFRQNIHSIIELLLTMNLEYQKLMTVSRASCTATPMTHSYSLQLCQRRQIAQHTGGAVEMLKAPLSSF